jgi:hypothetical protein
VKPKKKKFNKTSEEKVEVARGFETLPPAVADIIKSRTRPTFHIICLHHTFSGQQSLGHQKRNTKDGQNHEAIVPNLFCLGGPNRVQEVLFRDGEDLLRNRHECRENLTLF